MKRTPLQRRTPLRSGTEWRPARTPLRARSVKREREHRTEYLPLVRQMAAESTACELGPLLRAVDGSWRGCGGVMSGLHHLAKRSAGGALSDRGNVMRACSPCNGFVEDHPLLAHEAGLVLRSADR